jgi:hypothetical protein
MDHKVDHTPLFRPEFKNVWSHTSTSMPIHVLVLKLKDSVAFVPLFIVWKLIHCYMHVWKLREVIADVIALCVEVKKIICNENIRFFFIMPLTFLMLIWTV